MSEAVDHAALVPRLAEARILVVGDAMLDRYVYGEVERISPEAPVPVCRVTDETAMLGGAGNVVRNLAALGAGVEFIAAIGQDDAGAGIGTLLAELAGVRAGLVSTAGRATTVKTRYFAGIQQLLRTDREATGSLDSKAAADIVARAEAALDRTDVVVLSDYGKGVLAGPLAGRLIAAAAKAGRPIIVDPKGDDFTRYRGASLVTPNRRELAEASRMPAATDDEVIAAARAIIGRCGIAAVLCTRSAEGMTLVAEDAADHLPAEARAVFDVSGAGDTVVAAVAAALGAGMALVDAAMLANVAAGIVVGKVGTAVAWPQEMIADIRRHDPMAAERKVLEAAPALDRIRGWRAEGRRIGFTNGCFDLIHPGHVTLLAKSRAACDRLVVGLNGDASVTRLKGAGRPVQPVTARAEVLAALEAVDLVVVFDEDTPRELIARVVPTVLVKGGDYTREQVVGREIVEAQGGQVILIDLVPGHSTTAMVERTKAH
jgi:D-beta-D-heptose 7-phosphate kinase/D-beta-D-heptose 1-phosphate adenosyltransferase